MSGHVLKDFSVDNIKRHWIGLYGCVYHFSLDYDNIGNDDILEIHQYLIVKNNIKQCSGLKMFIALLKVLVDFLQENVSLNNEPCMARPTLIDLIPVELNYHPFMISLDKCNGSFNDVDDLSVEIYIQRETEDVNIKLLNMVKKNI